jgi:uncharacterized protein YaiI (UPF0178 family)
VAHEPRGEVHTADSIGERLAVRNLLEELRWAGAATAGPATYGDADRKRFAAALTRLAGPRSNG